MTMPWQVAPVAQTAGALTFVTPHSTAAASRGAGGARQAEWWRLDAAHGTIRFDGAHVGLRGEQIDERPIAREGQHVGGPVGAVRHAAGVQ